MNSGGLFQVVCGQAAVVGGLATAVAAALWHRHHFSSVTLPRRRFVQNNIIHEELDLFEADILSSVAQRMLSKHDVGATAVLDKFEMLESLERLGLAIAMDVDGDLLVRYIHVIKYVLFLRVHDCLAAPTDRPRSYLPFESILTYRSRKWLALALNLQKYLCAEFLHRDGRGFVDPSMSCIGHAQERQFIEQVFREETVRGLKTISSKHKTIVWSMCWDLLVGGKIAGRRREENRNRKVRLLSLSLIGLEMVKMIISAKMDLLCLVLPSPAEATGSVEPLGDKLKFFIGFSVLKMLREPLESKARRALKNLLIQEQQYVYAVSCAGIDNAFRDQPTFEKYCSLNDTERTARRATTQLLDFVRLCGASLYICGLFGFSVYKREFPLFVIGYLGGAVMTYDNLTRVWKRFVLGADAVVEKCELDFSNVDDRPLPAQKQNVGLRVLGRALAESDEARKQQTSPPAHLHLAVLVVASIHEKHEMMGDLASWQSWAKRVARALKNSSTAFNMAPFDRRRSSAIAPWVSSLVKDFDFVERLVMCTWTDLRSSTSNSASSLVSSSGGGAASSVDAQYLDADEQLMMRRSTKYMRVGEPQDIMADYTRFSLLRSLGVEVVHVFRCVREKRIMYESKLRKDTMDSATDPNRGGFSVLLEEICHVGLMFILHLSLHNCLLPHARDGIEALSQLKRYRGAFSQLSYRMECTFSRLIEMYELQHEAPCDISSSSVTDPNAASLLQRWRSKLTVSRPELRFDPHGRICGGFTLQDAIRFEAVRFSYPSTVATHTLDGLTFSIPAHSFTGIVGKTGSGKSTVLKLIKRLYDPFVVVAGGDKRDEEQEGKKFAVDGKEASSSDSPAEGQITLDGIPAKCFALPYLRSLVATVEQKPVVYRSLTIMENIAFFRPVTKDDVIAASKRAQCHNFIMALPMQYDTIVNREFSGGEMQRIAIARALVVPPTVLFLDEATSSLDAINEKRVQETIDQLAGVHGTTIVAIAHRLSTLKKADHLVVMMEGQCVQEGSHEELMAMSDEATPLGKNMYRIYMQGQCLTTRRTSQHNSPKKKQIPQELIDAVVSKLQSGNQEIRVLAQCLIAAPNTEAENPLHDNVEADGAGQLVDDSDERVTDDEELDHEDDNVEGEPTFDVTS